MKKGLIELRTGQKYTPGLSKEKYEDEIVDAGFEVDYESFTEIEKSRKLRQLLKIDLESISFLLSPFFHFKN